MDKQYNHTDNEQNIYDMWEKSGQFSPTDNPKAKPFTIIMPPPNANDPLHIGHAMFVAVEDILIRYHRMRGEAALWLPGTDHAGIETQFVFEKKLAKEGKSRFDFDRETLFQMVWDYVQENSQTALGQMKRLGASADWSRTKFTLDPEVVKVVLDTFKQLHLDGLVYRDLRLVNYCTKCGTSFSELEVVHVEKDDPLYYMKYGPFTLATVRPETKFGDTALAVNPNDKRYKEWIGKEVEAEGLMGKFKIKVISDEYVDPEFGTGVVKITPAHDPNDFEVWLRHKGEIPGPVQVIDFDGKLNSKTGKYQGLNIVEGRKQVVEDLKTAGLIEKIDEKYIHNVGTCYRCGRTLEPLPLPQFYIKTKMLTQKALAALDKNEVEVYGAGYDKILQHWLENLKDWNVSRQIVWGIRLPIWYKISIKHQASNLKQYQNSNIKNSKNEQIQVIFINKDEERVSGQISDLLEKYDLEEIKKGLQSLKAPMEAEFVVSPTPPGENYIQETDTFDTWFSSSQWPFVTLMTEKKRAELENREFLRPSGSPQLAGSAQAFDSEAQARRDDLVDMNSLSTKSDFERFYPTDVMETAYDILMFWVMRMLMMGIYKTGQVPFKKVYLHGLIRDQKGQKMSKSKGNVINPLEVIEKYGADALRMALVIRSTPGIDKNVGEPDFRAMRNLTNKIWNSARFIIMNRENSNSKIQISKQIQNSNDQKFKQKLELVVEDITRQLDDLKVGLAAETVYNEFWHWFCDEVIESNKRQTISDKAVIEGLATFLKLLHPFVPFVTEAVWQELERNEIVEKYKTNELLMMNRWPK